MSDAGIAQLHNVYPMKTKNSREPPFRFEAHDQQNMAGAISVDQFSPVFQRFDFTLGFVYVIATGQFHGVGRTFRTF